MATTFPHSEREKLLFDELDSLQMTFSDVMKNYEEQLGGIYGSLKRLGLKLKDLEERLEAHTGCNKHVRGLDTPPEAKKGAQK